MEIRNKHARVAVHGAGSGDPPAGDRAVVRQADPRVLIKNPVMFVVEIVAALTTVIFCATC